MKPYLMHAYEHWILVALILLSLLRVWFSLCTLFSMIVVAEYAYGKFFGRHELELLRLDKVLDKVLFVIIELVIISF